MGLDTAARHNRRAEIDSDLWEHRDYAAAEGEGTAAMSLSILGRWAAGIPADLSWRASQPRSSGQTKKENIMTNTLGKYWWQTLASLTAVATVYAGIRQFFTDEVSAGVSTGKVIALVFFLGVGALTLIGIAIHRTKPRRGAAMVIIGVAPMALVGGLGLGMVVGLVALLTGNLGDKGWLAVGISSAVATAAALGAFSAWWNAAPARTSPRPRVSPISITLVVVGLLAAGAGVSMGLYAVAGIGAVLTIIGVGIWSRRTRTAS
jgi:hypothetical protein